MGYVTLNSIQDLAGFWAPDDIADALVARYGTLASCTEYLERVFGENALELYSRWPDEDHYDIRDCDLIAEPFATLAFPQTYDLDPKDPETAQWALFAVERVVQREKGNYDEVTRFKSSDDVRTAIRSGVPLAYFKALDVPDWYTHIPVVAVIEAWAADIAPEFAYPVVYPS